MRNLLAALVIACSGSTALAQSPPSEHYAVGLTLETERSALAVDMIAMLPPAAAGDEMQFLLGNSYVVGEAIVEGARVDVAPTDRPWSGLQRIRIRFDRASPNPRLHLRYGGPLHPSGTPPLNQIRAALVELNLDSMWLPVRDDFAMPFTIDALIAGLAPGVTVAAQGEISAQGGWVRIRRSTQELDFAFVASPDMEVVRNGPFEAYSTAPNSEMVAVYMQQGPRVLAWLEERFGPLPGKPARIVIVDRERRSGYARRGYVVFTQGRASNPEDAASFMAHEFAHAWFANANPIGPDRWLDESLAEYVALRFVEHSFGEEALQRRVTAKRVQSADARAVRGASRRDAELYAKGPLLLIELERRIGRERMDLLVRRAALAGFERTEDFLAELRHLADAETAAWMESELGA